MVSRSVIWANDLFHQLSVPIKFYIYVKNYGESEKRVPRSCWLRKREKKSKSGKNHLKMLSRSAFWAVAAKRSRTYAFFLHLLLL